MCDLKFKNKNKIKNEIILEVNMTANDVYMTSVNVDVPGGLEVRG